MLLRCCLDAGQLGNRSLVDVVITKWDILSISEAAADAEAFTKTMGESLSKQFAERLGRLRLHNIAARPDTSDFVLGYGLDQLCPSWLEETPNSVLPWVPVKRNAPTYCEFDRFDQRLQNQKLSTQ